MNTVYLGLLFSLLFIGCNAVGGGSLNLGTTQSNDAPDFFMDWQVCDNAGTQMIYITLRTTYQGYAGIIPKPLNYVGGAHANVDLIVTWYDPLSGAQAVDMYAGQNCYTGWNVSNGYGKCNQRDSTVGGTDDVTCVQGWQNATGTSIMFKRPWTTTDTKDSNFRTGQMSIMWAFFEVAFIGEGSFNDYSYLHCHDCGKPIYSSSCGAAVTQGIRPACPVSGAGAVKRDSDYLVTFWDGTGTLPSCSTMPQTVCGGGSSGLSSGGASTDGQGNSGAVSLGVWIAGLIFAFAFAF